MVQTIELRLDKRILDRARQLARARHCDLEAVFADAIDRLPAAPTPDDPFLGMFKDEPELVDEVTGAAMAARTPGNRSEFPKGSPPRL